jgi:hypothetical protein
MPQTLDNIQLRFNVRHADFNVNISHLILKQTKNAGFLDQDSAFLFNKSATRDLRLILLVYYFLLFFILGKGLMMATKSSRNMQRILSIVKLRFE